MKKINRSRGKKVSEDNMLQGDLFAHVYQNPDKKIEVDTTHGSEQWNQFVSMVHDDNQIALLKDVNSLVSRMTDSVLLPVIMIL